MIQRIVSTIESRKINFEYNSCLFILTKSDEMEENINLNKIKEQIEDILFGEFKKGTINFFTKFYNKQNQIEVTKFSSKYFKLYLEIVKGIRNFKDFIQNQINEIIREAQVQYKTVDNLIKELSESVSNYKKNNYLLENEGGKFEGIEKYENELTQILIQNNISQNEIEKNKGYFEDIIKDYSYILNNLSYNKNFISSNGKNLSQILEKKFRVSNQMINNQFNQKLKDFYEAFKLIHIRLRKNKIVDVLESRKNMNEKLELINEEYKEVINEITQLSDNFFQYFYSEIDYINKNLEKEDVDLSKIETDINNLKDTYYNQFHELKKGIDSETNKFTEFIKLIVQESEKEEFELNESRLSNEDYSSELSALSNILRIIFFPIILNLKSIGDSIITYFKKKETIKKNLNKFKKKLNDEEKAFNYFFYEPLGKIMEDVTKKVNRIYKSREFVNKIEKEKFEQLYEKFKEIII